MSRLIKKGSLTTRIPSGFVLVEVILASSLFIILLTAFAGAFLYGQEATAGAGNKTGALMLAESGMEAVRNIRNEDFDNLTGGRHGLVFSNNKWSFSGTEDVSGIYTRVVDISTSTKDRASATTTVTWQQNPHNTGAISLFRTFSNWLDLRYWYTPGLVTQIGLANGGDKVQVVGNYAYVIGYTAPTLYIIDVTSSTSPTLVGSVTLSGTLANLAVSGNYVYVTSNDHSKELQVVNVTNKAAPSVAGSYNAAGNSDGIGIFADGTKLYMTRKNSAQDQFLILSISNPSNPSLVASLDLGADGYGLVASGTYAYVSVNNNHKEFQVINISNPNVPTLAGSADLSQTAQQGVSSVSVRGNYAYVGQGSNLYVVNISNPSSPVLKNVTSVTDAFNDISKLLGNKGRYIFVATSDVNKEFKVYDVSSSTQPVIYGTSLNLSGSNPLYGIDYATTTNIVYAVSHSTTNSFFIIAP